MKTLFVVLVFLGLFVGKVWACDSYEECMSGGEFLSDGVTSSTGHPTTSPYLSNQTLYLKAIAYKLDEISRTLKKPSEDYISCRERAAVKRANGVNEINIAPCADIL